MRAFSKRNRFSIDCERSRGWLKSKEGSQGAGATGAGKSRDSDDFAFVNIKLKAWKVDRDLDGTRGDQCAGVKVFEVPPDHRLDNLARVRIGGVSFVDQLAIPEDYKSITDCKTLGEAVADIHNAKTFCPEVAQCFEEGQNVLLAKTGCRFIKQKNLCIPGESLCNFDQLSLRRTERIHHRRRIDRKPMGFEDILCALIDRFVIDDAKFRWLITQTNIGCNREVWGEVKLLVDHLDAEGSGLCRSA